MYLLTVHRQFPSWKQTFHRLFPYDVDLDTYGGAIYEAICEASYVAVQGGMSVTVRGVHSRPTIASRVYAVACISSEGKPCAPKDSY